MLEDWVILSRRICGNFLFAAFMFARSLLQPVAESGGCAAEL